MIINPVQQYREFVTPQPRDIALVAQVKATYPVGAAQAGLQSLSDLLQQLVTQRVAIDVVDLLEAIKVYKQKSHTSLGASSLIDGGAQLLKEETSIGQPGQLVEVGVELAGLLGAIPVFDLRLQLSVLCRQARILRCIGH